MAGEDLLQYLILPPSASTPLSSTCRNPETLVGNNNSTEHRQHKGQLVESTTTAVNSPAPPSVILSAHTADKTMAATSKRPGIVMDHMQTLSDYRTEHSHQAPKPLSSLAPDPRAAPAPRALGARSSKFIIKLHEKHQALGIPKPEFIFTGDGQCGWSCKVVFPELLGEGEEGNVEVDEMGPFISQQEGKEKLSERALGVLEDLESAGRLKKPTKQKAVGAKSTESEKQHKESVINYIGQLLEYQRSTDSPQPTFYDYHQPGYGFSCELTIEGYDQPFSSKKDYFPSKKAARHNAARCAVDVFKSAGLWPDTSTDVGGIKKRKAASPNQEALPPKPGSPSTTSLTSDAISESPDSGSYASRVTVLAHQLGLPTPGWNYTSTPSAPGLHTVSCSFKNSGVHEGPIGEVHHIFGKKKAKEECARLVLEYLLRVKEERLENGKRMGDVAEAEGVVGTAVGTDNSKRGRVERDHFTEGGGGESEDEDGFEDALEEIAKGDV